MTRTNREEYTIFFFRLHDSTGAAGIWHRGGGRNLGNLRRGGWDRTVWSVLDKPWGVSHDLFRHRSCLVAINRGASQKGLPLWPQDDSVHAPSAHTASLGTTLCARNVWSVLHKPWEVSKRSRIRRRCSVAINRGVSHKGDAAG